MTSQQAATPLQSSVTSQQATNTSSHLFSATTFPVYFPPPGHDPGAKLPMSHMATPATYIRLPSTATLPLEKLQWVSHHGLMGVQAQNSVQPPVMHGDATPPKQQLSPVVQQASRRVLFRHLKANGTVPASSLFACRPLMRRLALHDMLVSEDGGQKCLTLGAGLLQLAFQFWQLH